MPLPDNSAAVIPPKAAAVAAPGGVRGRWPRTLENASFWQERSDRIRRNIGVRDVVANLTPAVMCSVFCWQAIPSTVWHSLVHRFTIPSALGDD